MHQRNKKVIINCFSGNVNTTSLGNCLWGCGRKPGLGMSQEVVNVFI